MWDDDTRSTGVKKPGNVVVRKVRDTTALALNKRVRAVRTGRQRQCCPRPQSE
jgi:hypothetical protein